MMGVLSFAEGYSSQRGDAARKDGSFQASMYILMTRNRMSLSEVDEYLCNIKSSTLSMMCSR